MAVEDFCRSLVSPAADSSFFLYHLVLGIPTIGLLVFLGWNLGSCLRKLRRSQSQIMTTLYGFLWLVALLNTARVIVQLLDGVSQKHVLWETLWLLTRFGLVLLEVSVLVFTLLGGSNSGNEALIKTVVCTSFPALIEILGLSIFEAHSSVSLYFEGDSSSRLKWTFWTVHLLPFLAAYLGLLIIPLTRWRALLPATPAFFRYIAFLVGVYFISFLGAVMLAAERSSGYCVFGFSCFVYWSLYPPLLYITFLAEFFQDTESDLDMMLYSEMKDAGVFEDQEYEF